MKQFLGRYGFIHRRLWQRDGIYRLALLAGPAPLLGAVIATAVWGSAITVKQLTYSPPPWATPPASNMWSTDAAQPQAVKLARPLPQMGPDGALIGYRTGWTATARQIEVGPLMDVHFKPDTSASFSMKSPAISMKDIVAETSVEAPYVGIGSGFFVVRDAGIYALAGRLERQPGPVANCLTRLGFGPRLITSYTELNNSGTVNKSYPAASFDLQPGLYAISWAFGCWHDQQVSNLGRLSILVRRPGEASLQPVRPDDIVH